MQSEFACHVGSNGKLFCRMCTVSNSTSTEEAPTASGPNADSAGPPPAEPSTDPSTNMSPGPAAAEESDLESGPESVTSVNSTGAAKTSKVESMQGMIDRVTRFVSVCS
jgi:hypothetical protein